MLVKLGTGQTFTDSTAPDEGNILLNSNYSPISLAANDISNGYLSFGKSYLQLDKYRDGGIAESTGILAKLNFKVLKKCQTSINFRDSAKVYTTIKGASIYDWFGNIIDSGFVTIQPPVINQQYMVSPSSTDTINKDSGTNSVAASTSIPSMSLITTNTYTSSNNVIIEGWLQDDTFIIESKKNKSGFTIQASVDGNIIKTCTSDSDGHYLMEFSTDSHYSISIKKAGYLVRQYDLNIFGKIIIGSQSSPDTMWNGDINDDNAINQADVMLIAAHNNTVYGDPNYLEICDLNRDGAINQGDVMIIAVRYGYIPSRYPYKIALGGNSTVNGTLGLYDISFDLNGYLLQVDGNMQFMSLASTNPIGVSLNINGGALNVLGELNFGQSNANDKLIMQNESDYIFINGNFMFASAIDGQSENNLSAGMIEIKGTAFNINELSNPKAFYATGTHKVMLSCDSGIQSVIFNNVRNLQYNNNDYSRFYYLILKRPNNSSNYSFTPNNCWKYLCTMPDIDKKGYGTQDGVYIPNGNYSKSYTDFEIMTPRFELSRTYNSQDVGNSNGPFGKCWTFSLDSNVTVTQDNNGNNIYSVSMPDSSRQTFMYIGSSYVPQNNHSIFTTEGTGYKLVTKDQYTYYYQNSNNSLSRVKDRYGNYIFVSEKSGNIKKVKINTETDNTGRNYVINYNTNGQITSIQEKMNNTVVRTVIYDYSIPNSFIVTDSSSIKTTFVYDTNGLLCSIKDNSDKVVESVNYVSIEGKVDSFVEYITDTYSKKQQYDYLIPHQTTITDYQTINGEDQEISKNRYSYDGMLCIQAKTVVSAGSTSEYTVSKAKYSNSACEEPSEVTDLNGNTTKYLSRDANGNVTQIQNPDGSCQNMTYDNQNNVTSIQDENGKYTFYIYGKINNNSNDRNVLMKKAQPLNGIDQYYDGCNEAGFAIITYSYYTDSECQANGWLAKGLLKSVTDPENNIVTYTYNADGTVASETNPHKSYESYYKSKTYAYNKLGLVEAEKSAGNFVTRYIYDDDGRLEKRTQHMCSNPQEETPMSYPTGGYSNYLYLHQFTAPYGFSFVTVSDKNSIYGADVGNGSYDIWAKAGATVKIATYSNGTWSSWTTNTYGTNTKLFQAYCPEDSSFNLKDINSNPLKCYASTARIIYDSEGRKAQGISPNLYNPELDGLNSSTVTHTYSNANCGTRYTYFYNGLVSTEKDPLNNQTSYTYDIYGNVQTKTLPNNSIYTYNYDILNRISSIYFKDNAAASPLLLNEYSYCTLPDGKEQKVETKYLNEGINSSGFDGSYDVDSNGDGLADGWTNSGCSVSMSSSIKMFGQNSQKIDVSNSSGNLNTSFVTISGHKYLFAGYYYQKNRGTGSIYAKANNGSTNLSQSLWENNSQLNRWLRSGVIFTAASSSTILTPCDISSQSCEIYLDGWRLIDLTAIYGAGKEPLSLDAAMNTSDTITVNDYAGRQVRLTNPDGGTALTVYNTNGTVNNITDGNGNTSYFTYDGLNRLKEQWKSFDTVDNVVQYIYSKNEYFKNGLKQTESTGKTEIAYGVLATDLYTKTYSYYSNGKINSVTDTEGKKAVYEYDGDLNLTREKIYKEISIGTVTYYSNNCFGKPYQKRVDIGAGEIMYTDGSINDSYRQLEAYYDYDKNGNLVAETSSGRVLSGTDSIVTTYEYDLMNRQTALSRQGVDENGAAKTIKTSITYDWDGQPITKTDANRNDNSSNGCITSYAYNQRRFLTQVTNTAKVNGVSTDFINAYYYDRAGRKIAEVTPANYDSGKTLGQMNRTEYTYDLMNRLKTKADVFQEKRFDTVNNCWLASQWITIVSKAYLYDFNGNIIKEMDASGYESGSGNTVDDRLSTGYGTVYTYNRADKLKTMLDPETALKQNNPGYTVKYSYDGLGRKRTETNAKGAVTTYYYEYERDGANNLLSTVVRNTINLETERTIQTAYYDFAGNLKKQTDGNGNTTYYYYNGLGKLSRAEYPGDAGTIPSITGNVIKYYYDTVGNVCQQQKTMGTEGDTSDDITDTYTYDNQGRQLTHTIHKHGETDITTQAKYDLNGNKRYNIEGRLVQTENQYDGLNRLSAAIIKTWDVSYTVQTTHTTSYSYDKNGNLTTTKDWINNTTTDFYDPMNRLIEKQDANSVSIQKIEYNHNNLQEASYDANGNKTTFQYDRNNRLAATIDPEHTSADNYNHITSQTYDLAGNVETKTDGRGKTTNYAYDNLNRLTSVTNVVNGIYEITSYIYDMNNNMLTQTRGGYTTTYEYNAANKLWRKIDHGGRSGTPGNYTYVSSKTEVYTYNPDGSFLTKKDRKGQTTTYTYYSTGNVKTQTVDSNPSNEVSYTYDAVGNVLTVTNASGTIARTYDEMGRVLSKTVPKSSTQTGTTIYTYDITAGVSTGFTKETTKDHLDITVEKIFDKNGRLDSVTADGQTTRYYYNPDGSRKYTVYNNAWIEKYDYYKDNMLHTLENRKITSGSFNPNDLSNTQLYDSYSYNYDGAHNMSSKTDAKGTTNYEYDDLERLKVVKRPGHTEQNPNKVVYEYDAAGNRKKQTETVGAAVTTWDYLYNEQNRLWANTAQGLHAITKKVNGTTVETTDYAYDNNGNQTNVYVNGIQTTVNTYTELNELKTSAANGTTITYTYNGEGFRILKKVGTNPATRYFYEYDKIVLETNDSTGAETARNVVGINVISRKLDGTGQKVYYLYNGHADVTALVDASTKNVVASYYYDEWGNPTYYDAQGQQIDPSTAFRNSIMYAGYQYDKESKLYYLNARMYDPVTGRFLQEDTVTGDPNDPLSLNLYTYCHNEPIMYTDPTGHTEAIDYTLGLSKEDAMSIEYYSQLYMATKDNLLKNYYHRQAVEIRKKYTSSYADKYDYTHGGKIKIENDYYGYDLEWKEKYFGYGPDTQQLLQAYQDQFYNLTVAQNLGFLEPISAGYAKTYIRQEVSRLEKNADKTALDKVGDAAWWIVDTAIDIFVPGGEKAETGDEFAGYYEKAVDTMSNPVLAATVTTAAKKFATATDHVVYVLKDAAGEVRYVGRTRFPKARELVHSNTPGKTNLKFERLYSNLTYEQARGLEDIKYLEFSEEAKKTGKTLLNKIKPIGLKNKNAIKYLDEGVKFLINILKKVK
jgi:RHS repeat-associated protein